MSAPAFTTGPARRRAPDRPFPQQSFMRNHNEQLEQQRRERWMRDLKRLGKALGLLALALGIAWWRMHR